MGARAGEDGRIMMKMMSGIMRMVLASGAPLCDAVSGGVVRVV